MAQDLEGFARAAGDAEHLRERDVRVEDADVQARRQDLDVGTTSAVTCRSFSGYF